MRFMNLLISLVGLTSSVAALTVNSPSTSTYWIQFATNTISWTTVPTDPSLVSLQIINSNSTLLNGVFSIAEYVPASIETYTVTNVTLIVADGYMVQMVNSTNATQVYATSSAFSVKPNGTAPAPGSAPDSHNSMSGNMTGMNMPGMNVTRGPGSHNGTGFNANANATRNGANSAAHSLAPASAVFFLVASALGLVLA